MVVRCAVALSGHAGSRGGLGAVRVVRRCGGAAWAADGRRHDLSPDRLGGGGLGAVFAAAGVCPGPAGRARSDPPAGLGGAGGVRRDSSVRRLVSRSIRIRLGAFQTGAAVHQFRADGHDLSGDLVGAVPQRLQPAGRHQEPHDLHRRHEAGPHRRDRARADPRFRRHRHGPARRHGSGQLRLRQPHARSHARADRRRLDRRSERAGRVRAERKRERPRSPTTIFITSRSTPMATA